MRQQRNIFTDKEEMFHGRLAPLAQGVARDYASGDGAHVGVNLREDGRMK